MSRRKTGVTATICTETSEQFQALWRWLDRHGEASRGPSTREAITLGCIEDALRRCNAHWTREDGFWIFRFSGRAVFWGTCPSIEEMMASEDPRAEWAKQKWASEAAPFPGPWLLTSDKRSTK